MYGFTPSATTEKLDRPPPDSRSSTPNRALFWRYCELRLVDARDRHMGQEPEDDQDPEDVDQAAPDVRRPEGVQQRVEHGRGVVAGRGRAVVVARRRGSSATASGASAVVGRRRGGIGLGQAPPRGRPAGSAALGGRAALAAFGGFDFSGLAAFSAAAVRRPPRPRPIGGGGVVHPLGRGATGRRPGDPGRPGDHLAVDAERRPGLGRGLEDGDVPPAASIFAVADFVNASATTKRAAPSSPLPRIFSGCFTCGRGRPRGARRR